jgi:putative ABC transport system permease protein
MRINIKLIIRNLLRDKSYPILNIIGLTIAFACSLAIILWVKNEFSYDRQLPQADRTYRLTFQTTYSGNSLHFARCNEKWISDLPASFPQIEQLIRLESYRHTALKINDNKFYSDRVFATDSNFFNVFGIKLLNGTIENVLNRPYSAVISSSIAKKCFGEKDPVGQMLFISGEYSEKETQYTVSGIMADSPKNSHIHFDILTSYVNPKEPPGWAYVYLQLKKGTKPEDLLAGLPAFINTAEEQDTKDFYKPFLQKITDIHLYSAKDREIEQNGSITRVWLFIGICSVLLLVSLINYFNLSKARIFSLQKQIMVQRFTGADTRHIISQSLIESTICVVISMLLALNLADLPVVIPDQVAGTGNLNAGFSALMKIWPLILSIAIITIISGSLPVILFASRQKKLFSGGPEGMSSSPSGFSSYAVLMTFQFCLSIILIVATLTINRQKDLIFSSSMGHMSSDILVFKRQNWEIRGKYRDLREQALRNPLIKNFTAAMEEPSGETLDALQVISPELDDSHKENPLFVLAVEDNFLDFFGLKLIAGRNFSPYNPERKGEDYILNEAAVKKLGWTVDQAIGRPFNIRFDTPDIFYGGTVVGVVRDFNFTSLKQVIKPYVLFQKPIFYLCFMIQVDSVRKQEAIADLKKIWEKELPDYPFEYEYISDLYKTANQKELSQAKLTSVFSLLAIVIICIGLFSVTSVMVARKTKEIGIRKVNGARVGEILIMLNSDFIKWWLIAFVIACPVAWIGMSRWLQGFVYKTELQWWIFGISALLVIAVTLLTVSIQSWRAATRNPIEALRYE